MGDKETPAAGQEAAPATHQEAAPAADQGAAPAADQEAAAPARHEVAAAALQALSRVLTGVVVIASLVGVAGLVANATWSRSLEITPAAQKVPAKTVDQSGAAATSEPTKADNRIQWKVTGRVLDGKLPSEGALVWCIGYDSSGNAFMPPAQRTNAAGEFTIDGIPEKLEGGDVTEIRITAAITSWPERWFSKPAVAVRSLSRASEQVKLSQLSTSWILAVPFVCFILTMALVVLASSNESVARAAYYAGLSLSLLLTACMVWSIADAINTFNTSVPKGEVRTLGFLTIFEGTYVEGSGAEWLVSLTYPSGYRAGAATATVVHSLGAPFWVIFLAVLGAGLLMIVTVIRNISDPPAFDPVGAAQYGERMRAILEHQFFVMFAPLSGIFIFQLLVLAGAAKEPVTVATIILGAGATLNGLLARAAKSAEQYLQGGSTK